MQVEKTVFISYRRTNTYMARAVYQHLTAHGYDCFLDSESINAGSFERIILNQIAARAHFVLVLTPSALERCAEPGDWLRREIEYALDNGRNIVPLMFDGFDYAKVQQYLTGKLAVLPQYNALEIPPAYFDEAMTRLQNRFLNKPLDVLLFPTPPADQPAVAATKATADQQPTVTEQSLNAETSFERGFQRAKDDLAGKISDYTEAIRLQPHYAEAHNNRGLAYYRQRDYTHALADFDAAIRIRPTLPDAYYNRGHVRYTQGDLVGALADYDAAIRLNPQYTEAYNNRGLARRRQGDAAGAIADYTEAIRLNPAFILAYNNRGNAYDEQGDYDSAVADYDAAIDINPAYTEGYYNRGLSHYNQEDYAAAVADYNEAIRLNPQFPSVYFNRANAYFMQADFDSAIADYETTLRLKPDHADAKSNLDLARQERGK